MRVIATLVVAPMPTPSPSPTTSPIVVVHTASSGAPWWAIPLVGGIFALIAVAVAQAISIRLDRRRRNREDERRLDAPLRQAALGYLAALQSYATFVTSLTVGGLLITGKPSVIGRPSEFDRWSEHQHEISDAVALLSLAAPATLLAMAEEIDEPSHRFNIAAQQQVISERMKYEHADEVYDLILPFRNAVRVHLGLEALQVRVRTRLASGRPS